MFTSDITTGDEDGITMAQAALIGHVEQFKPGTDDWEQYTERLEQYFKANSIEADDQKLTTFLTVMGPTAYALLSNLLAPEKPATKTYAELVTAMRDHLKPKPLVIAERFRFHQRNQADSESVADYMAELRKLADKCEFGEHLTEALRDQLVCGLRSETVQKRLLAEEDLTLKKAYETAISMEAASRRANELRGSTRVTTVPDGATDTAQYVGRKPRKYLSKGSSAPPSSACNRCGKTNHTPEKCFYRNQKCRSCGRRGHIAKMCRSPQKRVDLVGDEEVHEDCGFGSDPEDDNSPVTLLNIKAVESRPRCSKRGIIVDVNVNDTPLEMELDTGASVSLVSEKTWKRVLNASPLKHSEVRLKTYTGERLEVLGELDATVKYGEQMCQAPLLVVSGSGPSLFGRNWLERIKLDWGSIQKIETTADQLLQEYAKVFRKELGTVQGMQARLEVKEGAVPRFHKPRSVPYAIRSAIEQDLERLESSGIIEKVQYSDWAAPVVPVPKGDGGIRLCGDYKVTVNPVLKVDQYPVPTPEDLFATLAGGQTFTKLDLSQAYQQVCLEPESRKYVTINTHKGLYQYTRLPFGVASAPAVFQQLMEKILQSIPGVVVYLDDILITGKNEGEHLANLQQVLERFKQYGIRLKQAKCRIMKPSVDYLGYRIDKNGLHTLPEKIIAIQDAPRPKNVKELRSFLGLVNYYGRFIRDLTYPLNRLLCKGIQWG